MTTMIGSLRASQFGILIVLLGTIGAAFAQADYRTTNQGGGVVCLTEKAYDQFMDAILHGQKTKDYSWAESLLDGRRCFQVRKGLRVTLIDYGFLGVSQIYLHPPGGGAPVTVWTANENFQ